MGKRVSNKETNDFVWSAINSNQDECIFWPWSGNNSGYGKVTINKKRVYAHRFVCEQVNGAKDGAFACHSCGNGQRGCINPKHLYWGDASSNELDKIAHGTSNRGERHGMNKLTKEEVVRIKQILKCSTMTYKEIGTFFDVSAGAIHCIAKGRTWAWLK